MPRARRAATIVGAVLAVAALALTIFLVRRFERRGGASPSRGDERESDRAAGAGVADASPANATAPDVRRRRREIEDAVSRGPSSRLRKADLRPAMKAIAPLLQRCYDEERERDPQISGVINTKLTIRNEPGLGMIVGVNGFDTHGRLGESREFLACATSTFESSVLPPIETRGSLDVTYPSTFAPQPPDDSDKPIVDRAARAASEGRWRRALEDAEHGLELTSLDGPLRRRLIEIAGIAACHLNDPAKARHYFSLASPELEDRLQQACLRSASIDLTK